MTSSAQRMMAAAIVLLSIEIVAGLLMAYDSEAHVRSASVAAGDAKASDRVEVKASLISIDPVREEATFRLSFEPKGSLLGSDGTLTKELRLTVNAASGAADRPFPKGRVMPPTDVVVDLDNGIVTDYPRDRYDAELELLMVAPTSSGADKVATVATVDASLHGWKFQAGTSTKQAAGYALTHVSVSRSPATVGVAVFMMLLYWLLSISAVILTFLIAVSGRRLEAGMLTWCAGLLFALLAFRGAMPSAPGIGAFVDYAAVFPAEIATALCLVTLVVTYLRRLGAN